MRTGPFSQTKVIDRLNQFFVPVYLAQEDLAPQGNALPSDKDEYQRIYRRSLDKNLSTGTVHVYVVAPDGEPIDSLHVANAAKIDVLVAMMERTAESLKLRPGKALVAPRPQSCRPNCAEDALVLHLTSRPLKGGGSWDGVSENWIVYQPREISRLLPPSEGEALRVGRQWKLDETLAARLLTHVYPVTENNDVEKNQILDQSLTGRILALNGGRILARLDGRLKMRHNFYYMDDGNTVNAVLTGYVEFEDAPRSRITAWKLVTQKATYGGGQFGVAVVKK